MQSPSSQFDGSSQQLQQQRRRRIYEIHSVLPLHNSSSARLVKALHEERHDADVVWSTKGKVIEDVFHMAIESMWVRLQRHGRIGADATKPDGAEGMKADIMHLNMTQDELNSIDPDWRIFFLDISDHGLGLWPYWFMQHEMKPVLGWKRANYATRSAQNERYMDSWVQRMASDGDPGLPFGDYVGKPINYNEMYVAGNDSIAEEGCGSLQRLTLYVRESIVEAIDEYVMTNHKSLYEEATRGAVDLEDARLRLSDAIARLPRPMDARTFWNATVCNIHCAFRNHVSEVVASVPERHPTLVLSTNTDVVGFIHGKGRQMVHPDFIRGMMTTKVIVLAQRDRWEGHSRMYEALLSGALVMHDPQVYWPHGVEDGTNIVIYNSRVELEIKLLYYLDWRNEEERIEIGRRGRELALTHLRSWQQAERLFFNDMEYRNENGVSNKPW